MQAYLAAAYLRQRSVHEAMQYLLNLYWYAFRRHSVAARRHIVCINVDRGLRLGTTCHGVRARMRPVQTLT